MYETNYENILLIVSLLFCIAGNRVPSVHFGACENGVVLSLAAVITTVNTTLKKE